MSDLMRELQGAQEEIEKLSEEPCVCGEEEEKEWCLFCNLLDSLNGRLSWIMRTIGWRPIEEAPKDGTDVLVYCEESREQFVAFHREGWGWQYALTPDKVIVCVPSYFMPLPNPPES